MWRRRREPNQIAALEFLQMHQTSYKKGYQDGFQHGFLTAVAVSALEFKEKSWEEDYLMQKKKAREWAISMGYLKIKK